MVIHVNIEFLKNSFFFPQDVCLGIMFVFGTHHGLSQEKVAALEMQEFCHKNRNDTIFVLKRHERSGILVVSFLIGIL